MEFDSRSADRLPFHDPDEAEQALTVAPVPSRDAQRRHLQRRPLYSEFNEDELRRVAELSRIVEVPMGTAVTQIGDAADSFFVIIDGIAAVPQPTARRMESALSDDRRRSAPLPARGPRPRDTICQTQTPAALGPDAPMPPRPASGRGRWPPPGSRRHSYYLPTVFRMLP